MKKLENDFFNVYYYVIKQNEVIPLIDFESTQKECYKNCIVIVSNVNNSVYFRQI